MSLFIDFHVLQTVPPSCVNRDDTGSPKTAIYGGAVRARVSSQAWKHAMREEFKKLFAVEELGSRTKSVVEMVEKEMYAIDSSIDKDDCHKKAISALDLAGIKVKSPKKDENEKEYLNYDLKPQLKILGPKYGSKIGAIRNWLASCDSSSVVDAVNKIIIYAVNIGASDIHFDPREDSLVVRRRIDGDLVDYTVIPKVYVRNLVTRLKYLKSNNSDDQ